ncbi:MAG: D-alanyl-D-alanine carboxypeptidase [Actinobacteria bacterium 13_1_20CM_3_71_11]|nr:MAG: D-alanyl-D-alanine carboxypeptidase [Actinobacteria bacterium 13_1_20CM_3_71_11]
MSGWRVLTALAGAALIGSPPAVPPSAAPVFVPCPYVAQPRPVPPQPSPPARDPARPVLGGPGLATAGLTVPAGVPTPPAVSATAWLVADLDTGEVLGACGPHEQHRPASVQKLLLAETMLPRLDPTQVVEVTPDDLNIDPGSSAVGVLPGGRYTVETLWLGLLLESGNDTANVLARLGGGDAGLAGGIAAMNAEAHRLGADDTHAVSSSGLDRPGQFTSAYDLALIARADFARDDFRRYDTALRAQIPPQPPKDPRGFQIQNENQLLTRYPGALGGKTGFTDQARHTYVGAAQRNGRRLVVTLLGAEAFPVRGWQQGAALLDWGFGLPADGSVGHLVTPDEVDRLRNPPTPRPASKAPVFQRAMGGGPGTGALGLAMAVAAVPLLVIAALCPRLIRRAARRRGLPLR